MPATIIQNPRDPIFIPIQSPPFQRIPTSDEAPLTPSSFNTGTGRVGGFLQLEIVLRRDDILHFFSFLLIIMIFIPLCIRLNKRLKQHNMKNIRMALQIIFTALNITWIVGCLFLLGLSAHIFLSNSRDKVDRIERTFPWYIITIVSCCFIELIEALFGLNQPADESNMTRVINFKSKPLSVSSSFEGKSEDLTDDQKLLMAWLEEMWKMKYCTIHGIVIKKWISLIWLIWRTAIYMQIQMRN